jgi:hypothetical protein
MKFYCKYCSSCKQIGRQNSNCDTIGRKRYYCEHEGLVNIKNKNGFPIDGFIGFGENNWRSPLVLKTSPRWCPRKIKENGGI